MSPRASIEWLRKVVDDGQHNAVTDLALWRGQVYLAYRRAENHFNEPPGEIRVVRSADLERWAPCGRVHTGLDDRDPRLVEDGARMALFFGSAQLEPRGARTRWIESHVCWTEDGERWTAPQRVGEPGWWLWHPSRFHDGWWCAAYGSGVDEDPPEQRLELLHSADGERWNAHGKLLPHGVGNEATLVRESNRSMLVVVRGSGEETILLSADPPYERWRTSRLAHWLHGPAAVRVGDTLVLAGRDRSGDPGEKRYVTRLWTLHGEQSEHLLDLPSGGDTSYCGLVALDRRRLLVSWYSQHEFLELPGFEIAVKPAAVYLALLRLEDA